MFVLTHEKYILLLLFMILISTHTKYNILFRLMLILIFILIDVFIFDYFKRYNRDNEYTPELQNNL